MRIFLAGGLGVVGRRTVPLLVAKGHEVRVAVSDASQVTSLAAAGAEPCVVDLFDESDVSPAVASTDVVIDLTSRLPRPSHAWRPAAWLESDRVNRIIARTLVDAALASDVGRLIQESTILVYADGGDSWISEDAAVESTRVTQSFFDAEAQVDRMTAAGRVGVILRLGFAYSADCPATRSAIRSARRGFGATIGTNDGYVSMINADDAAAAVVAALDVPSGTYNVTEDQPVTKLAQMDALASALGARRLNSTGPAVAALGGSKTRAMSRSLRVSNRRLRAASDWAPRWGTPEDGWVAVVEELGA